MLNLNITKKTMSERMMLSQLDQDLSGSGAELSDETYRELLGIMHDERENFNFSSDLTDQENTDISPERFSRQNLQNFANDMKPAQRKHLLKSSVDPLNRTVRSL